LVGLVCFRVVFVVGLVEEPPQVTLARFQVLYFYPQRRGLWPGGLQPREQRSVRRRAPLAHAFEATEKKGGGENTHRHTREQNQTKET
jgi:hypothetical protein